MTIMQHSSVKYAAVLFPQVTGETVSDSLIVWSNVESFLKITKTNRLFQTFGNIAATKVVLNSLRITNLSLSTFYSRCYRSLMSFLL